MSEAPRDQNHVPTALGVSSVDSVTPTPFVINPVTGRLLTDVSGGGSGTVTSVSVVSANGLAGTVATATTTPAITLSTTITGILKGNGTAISAATDGTDYLSSTTGLKLDQTSAQTITNDTPIFNTLTASELVATTAAKKLQSLAVATYPSLTEISYVKGVTSAIQTQINSRVADTGDTMTGALTIGVAGTPLTLTNTTDTGAATGLIVQGDRATPTANDEVIIELKLSDSAGNQDTMGTIRAQALDVTSTSEDSQLKFGTMAAGTLASRLALTSTQLGPNADDGIALGSTALRWSDLFLASGGVINWNAGNATITHSAALLTFNTAITLGTSNSFTCGSIELGAASDTTLSRSAAGVMAVEGVVIPSISSTNTLTNKRITKRTGTTTSSATPTINTDNVDFYSITAQTEAITSFTTNLSGTPTEGQTLWIAITGTAARAITWGASFEASTVALPTTTVTTARLDVGFIWNTVTSKWRCIASA